MFGKLGNLVVAGLAALGLYEGWSRFVAPELGLSKVTLVTGHWYALVFDYTKDPPNPLVAADVQSALDLTMPGQFKVLTGSLVPGPRVQTRQFAVAVEYMGQSAGVSSKMLTDGFHLDGAEDQALGRVTLCSSQDMGVSPTATGTAAALATS